VLDEGDLSLSVIVDKSLLVELHEIIDRNALHEQYCEALRQRYGPAASGRAVIELCDYVEADEKRVIAEIKMASDRKARELTLLIDSPGGLVTAKWRIISALDAFKGRKRGVVVGRCSSAATAVLVACDERIAPATAEFLIHCPGFYANSSRYPYQPPRYTAASLDQEATRLAGHNTKLANFYFARTGSLMFKDMVASGEDYRLSAAEARSCNLITKIEPTPPVQLAGPLSHYNYFRPKVAQANRVMKDMARQVHASVASFICLEFRGEIGEHKSLSAARVKKQLATAPYANSVLVFFDTIGGTINEAAQIYAALAEHPADRKKAIITGDCQSAALLPLMACNIRFARPRATIMLHGASVSPFEYPSRRWTAEEHTRVGAEVAKVDAMLAGVFAERTGYDREFFVREMKNDKPLRLVDALNCGLIHEIEGLSAGAA
jgi:ATP-dependent protease ClpP protease subunit